MSFNPNLTYFVERLQGVSTNTFRLESQNRTTALQNDIISFSLPSNAILNLRSFKVWCNANCNAGSPTAGARLPPISDLVERIEVSVGGIILSQGTNFSNVLQEAMKALSYEDCDSVTGHPEYVREISYVNGEGDNLVGGPLDATANESYADNGNLQLFCIDKFPGFLATADPKLLDTSILPDITVRLYMATNNLLTTSQDVGVGDAAAIAGPPPIKQGFAAVGGTGNGGYELTNISATIEAIGMADMTYDQMISAQMAQQGFLEIPYKAYTTFQESHTGASRFTVSTQSLDRVWVAWRVTAPNTQVAPVIVNGYKKQGAFIQGAYQTNAAAASGAAAGTSLDLGLPQYDLGGVFTTNSEKYKSAYFNFVQPPVTPNTNMKMQLQLNGAYMPQFSANLGQLYGMTRNSIMGAREAKNMSFDQYVNNYCVQCFRLNLPDAEYSRSICGLDTRAVNLQGVVKTDNVINLPTINIFTEQTETLRVGPGRSIEVIS